VDDVTELATRCRFPAPGASVDLAVSGGADSVGLTLLATAAGLRIRLHHVDHHLRPDSARDAELVRELGRDLGVDVVVHDVEVEPGGNLEARARAARRSALPVGALTAHTMDDLAETVLLNLMRGAGVDGLSPMVGDPTKPMLDVRRDEVRRLVEVAGRTYVVDPTNADVTFRRNRVRAETLPLLNAVAERDLVPVLARQAALMADERTWIDELVRDDLLISIEGADCRMLRAWPTARLRRWVRAQIAREDVDGVHPPTSDEVERVIDVIAGRCVATQVAGSRRVARREQRLRLEQN
jgi:tRNA(Ile)-lysidine synthase